MKKLILALGAVMRPLSRVLPQWGRDPTALSVGTMAPDFTLPDSDGNAVTLSQLRGKKVLLLFYPGDATPICSHQLTEIDRRLPSLIDGEVAAYGVNPAPARLHKKFRDRFGIKVPLLVDDSLKVSGLYGARTGSLIRRTLVWIDEEGTVARYERGAPKLECALPQPIASSGDSNDTAMDSRSP